MADRLTATGSNPSQLAPASPSPRVRRLRAAKVQSPSTNPNRENAATRAHRNYPEISHIQFSNREPADPPRANISPCVRSCCVARGGTVNRPLTHVTCRKQRLAYDQGRNIAVQLKSAKRMPLFRSSLFRSGHQPEFRACGQGIRKPELAARARCRNTAHHSAVTTHRPAQVEFA